MELSLNLDSIQDILAELTEANKVVTETYPGDSPDRQPVHTLYGGAQLFKSDSIKKIGALAVTNFKEYAPNFVVLSKALSLPNHDLLPSSEAEINALVADISANPEKFKQEQEKVYLLYSVYKKIENKISVEAVEDFRIDFEDGFGNRPDEEEDATAIFAAEQLAKGALVEGLLGAGYSAGNSAMFDSSRTKAFAMEFATITAIL